MSGFEASVRHAIEEQRSLNAQLDGLRHEIEGYKRSVAQRDGRIQELDRQLTESKNACDYYLKWATEVTKQLHNVGVFVNDALRMADAQVDRAAASKAANGAKQIEPPGDEPVREDIDPTPETKLPKAVIPDWLKAQQNKQP
jgi:chromosome segregation ATPase